MTRHLGPLITFTCVLIISGCASSPRLDLPQTSDTTEILWQGHHSNMLAINQWQLSGKIGYRTPEQASSASLNWLQQGEEFNINLSGPLGQGGAKLSGNKDHIRLKVAGQGEFTSSEPEQLLEQKTGWTLPLSSLLHWIRGVPAPQLKAHYKLDEQGRISHLTQHHWQIDYLSYHRLSSNWLPKKIKLHYGQTTLTLIIKQWDTSVTAS